MSVKPIGYVQDHFSPADELPGNLVTGTIPVGAVPAGVSATRLGDGSVDNTEFKYIDGATSNIQQQLNSKLASNGDGSALTNLSASSINGVLDIAHGGTFATTAINARFNLGVAIGSNVQAWSTNLDTWSTFTPDNDPTLIANSTLRVPTQNAIKLYIDNKLTGLNWKIAVRAASITNGALATAFKNGSIVDGVTLVTGDRILIKNQTNPVENGIYTVNATGAPTRAVDADTGPELVQATMFVSQGTVNSDTQWTCTNNTVTLGVTGLTFAQVSGAGTYSAGIGLQLLGNQFSLPNVGPGAVVSPYPTSISLDNQGRVTSISAGDSPYTGGPLPLMGLPPNGLFYPNQYVGAATLGSSHESQPDPLAVGPVPITAQGVVRGFRFSCQFGPGSYVPLSVYRAPAGTGSFSDTGILIEVPDTSPGSYLEVDESGQTLDVHAGDRLVLFNSDPSIGWSCGWLIFTAHLIPSAGPIL